MKLWTPRLGWLAVLVALASLPATAGVVVTFDAETLNDLLSSLSTQEVEIAVAGDTTLKVSVENMEVVGLDPPTKDGDPGSIRTALRLRVPQLGMTAQIKPRLSLHVVKNDLETMLELRFEEVSLPLPLGSVDLAPLLPAQRFPADAIFVLAGAGGDVEVVSRLTRVTIEKDQVRFDLELDVQPAAAP
jgi:hypothetical protein